MPDGRASASREPGYRLANLLSYVINPLVLPPIGFALILHHFGAPGGEIALISLIALVFFTLLPLWYLVRMVRRGAAESIEVRQRAARARPFMIGVAFYIIGTVLIALTGQTALPLLISLALLYPVNTIIVVLITLRWKISVHMIGLAGFISVLLFASLLVTDALPPREGTLLQLATVLPLMVLLPILMWARVRVEAHTFGQVVAGTVFGLVLPYVELTVLLRLFGLL